MKLSDLILYRNQLQDQSLIPSFEATEHKFKEVMATISQFGEFASPTHQLEQDFQRLQSEFQSVESSLDQVKASVKRSIEILEPAYFQQSYQVYEHTINSHRQYGIYDQQRIEQDINIENYNKKVNHHILVNRQLAPTPEAKKIYRARVAMSASWEYPGMIIHPGLEPFILDMVGLDPLYLVDERHDLLKPCMQQFPESYQQRLRPYIIDEFADRPLLEKLPNQQFGVILAYNYFNYRPFELIKKYLMEIYTKLRPGGVLICTYNDCDRSAAVQLVENHFACYTPGFLIISLAESLGFEIVFKHHENGASTWAEFKKPGQRTTLRGGQTLAKILSKPVAKSK